MKIQTLVIVAAALVGTALAPAPSAAQATAKPKFDRGVTAQRERADPPLLKELSKVCNLTAQQYGQIKLIVEARTNAVRAAKKNSTNAQQLRERVRQIHQEAWQKIEAVLTPQQRAKWQDHVKSKRKDRDGIDPTPGPGTTPGKPGLRR